MKVSVVPITKRFSFKSMMHWGWGVLGVVGWEGFEGFVEWGGFGGSVGWVLFLGVMLSEFLFKVEIF